MITLGFVLIGISLVCVFIDWRMGIVKRNNLEAENEALKKEIQRLRDECAEFFI
jgi:hypothetical protein